MISATSPNQEGVEGIDSRSGLDTHRDIGDTSHVYLLVGNSVVLPHQGGIFLSWFATGYISLRHSWALQQASAEDVDQYHRLDYVRFFRRPDGAAERSLLADHAARLRAAYLGRVPQHLVSENIRRLSEPGALTATLNWYRAVDDNLTVPAGRIAVPTLYIWGSEDAALGRNAATRTAGFIDGPYRFEILEGASHWLPEEAPGVVVPLLLKHLSAQG